MAAATPTAVDTTPSMPLAPGWPAPAPGARAAYRSTSRTGIDEDTTRGRAGRQPAATARATAGSLPASAGAPTTGSPRRAPTHPPPARSRRAPAPRRSAWGSRPRVEQASDRGRRSIAAARQAGSQPAGAGSPVSAGSQVATRSAGAALHDGGGGARRVRTTPTRPSPPRAPPRPPATRSPPARRGGAEADDDLRAAAAGGPPATAARRRGGRRSPGRAATAGARGRPAPATRGGRPGRGPTRRPRRPPRPRSPPGARPARRARRPPGRRSLGVGPAPPTADRRGAGGMPPASGSPTSGSRKARSRWTGPGPPVAAGRLGHGSRRQGRHGPIRPPRAPGRREPAHGRAVEAGLVDGLGGTDVLQFGRPVRGAHQQRHAGLVGLDHGRMQLGGGRPAGHDDHGRRRSPRPDPTARNPADRSSWCTCSRSAPPGPAPGAAAAAAGEGEWLRPRPRAHDRVPHAAAPPLVDQRGREPGLHVLRATRHPHIVPRHPHRPRTRRRTSVTLGRHHRGDLPAPSAGPPSRPASGSGAPRTPPAFETTERGARPRADAVADPFLPATPGRRPGTAVPAIDILETLPIRLRAEAHAVLAAVADATASFSGGGKWEAMHGDGRLLRGPAAGSRAQPPPPVRPRAPGRRPRRIDRRDRRPLRALRLVATTTTPATTNSSGGEPCCVGHTRARHEVEAERVGQAVNVTAGRFAHGREEAPKLGARWGVGELALLSLVPRTPVEAWTRGSTWSTARASSYVARGVGELFEVPLPRCDPCHRATVTHMLDRRRGRWAWQHRRHGPACGGRGAGPAVSAAPRVHADRALLGTVGDDLARDHETIASNAWRHGRVGGGSCRRRLRWPSRPIGEATGGGPAVWLGYSMGARLALHVASPTPWAPWCWWAGRRAWRTRRPGGRRPGGRPTGGRTPAGRSRRLPRAVAGPPLFAGLPGRSTTSAAATRPRGWRRASSWRAPAARPTCGPGPELAAGRRPSRCWRSPGGGRQVLRHRRADGDRDRPLPPSPTPAAAARLVPGAGHAAHLERPSTFLTVVRSWLRASAGQGRQGQGARARKAPGPTACRYPEPQGQEAAEEQVDPSGVGQHGDEVDAPVASQHRHHRPPGRHRGRQGQDGHRPLPQPRHQRHHHHRPHQQPDVQPAGAHVAEAHGQRPLARGRVARDVAQVVDHQQGRDQEPDRDAGAQRQPRQPVLLHVGRPGGGDHLPKNVNTNASPSPR